eukprot:1152652-Pelagomonas_calceolata.AAC.3
MPVLLSKLIGRLNRLDFPALEHQAGHSYLGQPATHGPTLWFTRKGNTYSMSYTPPCLWWRHA